MRTKFIGNICMQSASGGADLGSAAKTILSGLANSLTSGGQQAASTQTTGVAKSRCSMLQ